MIGAQLVAEPQKQRGKEANVKGSSMASKPCSLVCPLCEAGRLHTLGHDQARCDSCLGPLSGAMLEALSEIAILQNAVGSHACECGHHVNSAIDFAILYSIHGSQYLLGYHIRTVVF